MQKTRQEIVKPWMTPSIGSDVSLMSGWGTSLMRMLLLLAKCADATHQFDATSGW